MFAPLWSICHSGMSNFHQGPGGDTVIGEWITGEQTHKRTIIVSFVPVIEMVIKHRLPTSLPISTPYMKCMLLEVPYS